MMKSLIPSLLLAGMALGLNATPAPYQHVHEHEHAQVAENTPDAVAIPQQRFATDAPLREGMQRVHQALAELDHYPIGRMSESMVLDRVQTIKDAGAYMFANCKLPETPDMALHGMLVPLLAAAQRLADDPADTAQVKAMQDAVADYPRYFDDPGWSAAHDAAQAER